MDRQLRDILNCAFAKHDTVRVLSRIFCLGGKSILKKIFEPRGGEKNFFRPSRGSSKF